MPIIDELTDSAAANDTVSHLWVNAVNNRVNTSATDITTLQGQVSTINTKLAELTVTAGTGLSVNFTGGTIINASGTYVTIAPGSLVVPANATRKIFVNEAGIIAQAATVPERCLELATVTTGASTVTNVALAPRLTIGRSPVRIVEAYLNNQTDWTSGVFGGIAGWQAPVNIGGALDVNSGLLTVPETGRYRIEVSLAFLAQVTATNVRLSVSLYGGANELKILDTVHTANVVGGEYMILNGWYETRTGVALSGGTVLRLETRATFTSASPLRLKADENNAFILWRL